MKLLLAIAFLSTLTSAAKLSISIPANTILANPSTLPTTTFATLPSHGVPQTAYLNRHSAFIFPNLAPGSYLFSAHCRDYFFEPLRVDVSRDADGFEKVEVWQTFRGNEWSNKGEKRGEGLRDVTATVKALGPKEYYQVREGFDVLGFLKSPMILMALFSLGMIVGIPYLMENMDEETLKEYQEIKKSNSMPKPASNNAASSLQNFDMAGWLAGAPSDSGSSSKKK